MQKMIFSAVALVAFSFAGMANEIEEVKIRRVELSDCEVLATIQTSIADEEHTNATGNSWDDWTIEFVYSTYLSNCENN